jgi:hypothetical protein
MAIAAVHVDIFSRQMTISKGVTPDRSKRLNTTKHNKSYQLVLIHVKLESKENHLTCMD